MLSEKSGEVLFETKSEVGRKRGVDRAINRLATSLREVGVWSILTPGGYRFYFCTLERRRVLPPLAAVYAAMFYLGSITRYKPYDFDRILRGGYSWVVEELITTMPHQFLYLLASELAGVDVVRPYASVE